MQERSPFEELGLPTKCFISHAYKDMDTRQRLLALLPERVEPFIFPPIVAPPHKMVSDKLLDAIRKCDGLIYLQGGASAQSFWVALERDYALRQGKPVFAFDPETQDIALDKSPPMDLIVYFSHSDKDTKAGKRIAHALQERYIVTWFDQRSDQWPSEFVSAVLTDVLFDEIQRRVQAGGYVVALWSKRAHKSLLVADELNHTNSLLRHRVLFALLDGTPTPMDLDAGLDVVQLFGDKDRSFDQRIDDLIVRLYWLIYRNTRQNQLS